MSNRHLRCCSARFEGVPVEALISPLQTSHWTHGLRLRSCEGRSPPQAVLSPPPYCYCPFICLVKDGQRLRRSLHWGYAAASGEHFSRFYLAWRVCCPHASRYTPQFRKRGRHSGPALAENQMNGTNQPMQFRVTVGCQRCAILGTLYVIT